MTVDSALEHELIVEYGTPLYVYDLDEIDAAVRDLRVALPSDALILYSVKANPHPAIAAHLAQSGLGAEVSSIGELTMALEMGFDPREIVLTGPAKPPSTIEHAITRGCQVSLESIRELELTAELIRGTGAQPSECLVRLNPSAVAGGSGLRMGGAGARFGIDADGLAAGWHARSFDDFVTGFHVFQGSNYKDVDGLLASLRLSLACIRHAADITGITPRLVDLGGGFPARFASNGGRPPLPRRSAIEAVLNEWPWETPRVMFESGRYMVGSGGTLLCSVVDVKQLPLHRIAVTDSGLHHLGGMWGTGRLRHLGVDVRWTGASGDETPLPTEVAGSLCTPLDSWGVSPLPQDLRPGHILSVSNVGAYGLTASLVTFLSHRPPVEVVIAAGRVAEASQLTVKRIAAQRRAEHAWS